MDFETEWQSRLEEKFGEVDHTLQIQSAGKPRISVFYFENLPANNLTAITCGLSNADMPDWKYARPELMVSLNTKDKSWGLAAGYFASAFYREKLFIYGSLFTMEERISPESNMTGFFEYIPSFLSAEEATFILSDRKIILAGMYPVYREELDLFNKIGVENFFRMKDFDMYDVTRKNLGLEET